MMWILGLFFALGVYAGALWIGWNLLGRPSSTDGRGDPMVSMWFGWFFQAMVILVLGWLGVFRVTVFSLFWGLPLAGIFLDRNAFYRWLQSVWTLLKGLLPQWGFVRVFCGASLLWVAASLFIRPFFFDTLFYGYGLPLSWLNRGGIHIETPDVFAFISVPPRMHYVWAMALGGDPQVAFSLFIAYAAGAVLLLRMLHAMELAREWREIGLLIYLGIPALWEILLLRKDDMFVVWGGVVLAYFLFHFLQHRVKGVEALWMVGLSSGMLLAVKQTGTPGYIAGVLLVCFFRYRPRRLWKILVLIFGIIIPLIPILIHSILGSGSVLTLVAPYLSDFPLYSTRWRQIYQDSSTFWQTPMRDWGKFLSWGIQRFYVPRGWHFAGFLGFMVLFFTPVALVAETSAGFGLSIPVLTGFLGYLVTNQLPRFTLSFLPLIIILIIRFAARWVTDRRFLTLVSVAFLIHIFIYLDHPVTGTAIRALGPLHIRTKGPELLPSAVILGQWINANLDSKRDRVLYVGEMRYYPCRIPFVFWDPYFRHPLEVVSAKVPPETRWDQWVKKHGITFIVYTPSEARRLFEWSEQMHRRFERWLRSRGRIRVMLTRPGPLIYLIQLRVPNS